MSVERSYPQKYRLGDDRVRVHRLSDGDGRSLRRFAKKIPEHDKLFSHWDLALEESIASWERSVGKGKLVALAAIRKKKWLGYAAIEPSQEPWSGHVAELRVMVAPKARGRGVGRILLQEAFRYGISVGLEKLTARMTPDQAAAIRSFEDLGFKTEAMFREHVEDTRGRKHDLLVLSNNLRESRAMDDVYGVVGALNE